MTKIEKSDVAREFLNILKVQASMDSLMDMDELTGLSAEVTKSLIIERAKIELSEEIIPEEITVQGRNFSISDEFLRPTTQFVTHEKIKPSADKKIREISHLTQCYALAESGSNSKSPEIVRILSPETSWLSAWNAARAMECDVYEVMVKVGYEILPEIRPFKLHSQLGEFPKESVKDKSPVEFKDKVPADFHEILIPEEVKARFKGSHSTLFRCVMDSENGEVVKVFTNDIPWAHIVKHSLLMEYHVFHIRARMTFVLGKWAKRVKTFEELRKG